jgi:hypothetical protein
MQCFFLFFYGAKVEPSPLLLRPFIGLLKEPWKIDGDDCGAISGTNERQEKPKYAEEICPSTTLSATLHTWIDPSSNPGHRGRKPESNRLSCVLRLRRLLAGHNKCNYSIGNLEYFRVKSSSFELSSAQHCWVPCATCSWRQFCSWLASYDLDPPRKLRSKWLPAAPQRPTSFRPVLYSKLKFRPLYSE